MPAASSSLISHLFPSATFSLAFTTADLTDAGNEQQISQVELSDPALGVHKTSSRHPHNVVIPPPPSTSSSIPPPQNAWEAVYPKGSINPSGAIFGGFGFYLSGPPDFAKRLESANEVVMSYRVMFEDGWEWVKGGKIPGIFGGIGDLAYRCSGGRQSDRCKCFGLRLMWRAGGKGEIYAYIPLLDHNTERLLDIPPESHKNPDYGFSVGRGAWKFPKGTWTTIAERVKLNSVGEADGEVQLWIDGVSVIHATELILREDAESQVKGMHFQTFFGGNKEDWASPKDQNAWFADVSGAIIC